MWGHRCCSESAGGSHCELNHVSTIVGTRKRGSASRHYAARRQHSVSCAACLAQSRSIVACAGRSCWLVLLNVGRGRTEGTGAKVYTHVIPHYTGVTVPVTCHASAESTRRDARAFGAHQNRAHESARLRTQIVARGMHGLTQTCRSERATVFLDRAGQPCPGGKQHTPPACELAQSGADLRQYIWTAREGR